MSRLVAAKEILVLLHSNIALIFRATILLKLIFSNLLGPLHFKAIRMGTFKHQCFQVHFDFVVPVFSTSKKYHAFSNEKVVTAQFDRGR